MAAQEKAVCFHQQSRKELDNLQSAMALDMERQSLKFSKEVASLALVEYFLTLFPSLHFGIIICHYLLEVCDLFLY